MTEIKKEPTHTISILVANKPGVLVRVALVFARRGYNIDSLVVSATVNPKYSRMTITAKGSPETLDQIIKNVDKLVDVIHASEHDPSHSIDRELALIKVKDTPSHKEEITKYSKKYHAKIVDETEKALIIAQSGTTVELDEFEAILKKMGILEYVRSGKLLMARGKEET
ncbi:MAG: acetolactate synthase small subunit [Candidatus Omnitrophica bacterium]|nr:acetolactate synthase small subunit [Candidatus Omnitrophota bacterium]